VGGTEIREREVESGGGRKWGGRGKGGMRKKEGGAKGREGISVVRRERVRGRGGGRGLRSDDERGRRGMRER